MNHVSEGKSKSQFLSGTDSGVVCCIPLKVIIKLVLET